MAKKKFNIDEAIKMLGEKFDITPDTVVIGVADEDGHCMIHLQGIEQDVALLVNEVMGHAVAKMPKLMQEVMLAEILGNAKATPIQ